MSMREPAPPPQLGQPNSHTQIVALSQSNSWEGFFGNQECHPPQAGESTTHVPTLAYLSTIPITISRQYQWRTLPTCIAPNPIVPHKNTPCQSQIRPKYFHTCVPSLVPYFVPYFGSIFPDSVPGGVPSFPFPVSIDCSTPPFPIGVPEVQTRAVQNNRFNESRYSEHP